MNPHPGILSTICLCLYFFGTKLLAKNLLLNDGEIDYTGDVDLKGKHVEIVGTGASAIQVEIYITVNCVEDYRFSCLL